jgi:hypothetical protein
VVGIVIGSLSMMAIATQQAWEEWTNVVLGIWLIASPWLLGFSQQSVATNDMMIVGAVVVLFSLLSLVQRSPPQHTAI